jgi:hypothetical protein
MWWRYDKKEKREGAERKPSYIILKRFWILRKPVFPLLFVVVIILIEVRGIGTNSNIHMI